MDVQPVPALAADVVAEATPGPTLVAPHVNSVPGSRNKSDTTIAPAIAKLFSSDGIAQPEDLTVSYRVLKNPNEIVTVFTDTATGKEVVQVPSEVMVEIAEFFDQQQGVTLDRNA